MAAKELLFDLSLIDFDKPTADIHEIRKYNPQRFEMEQLTAIVYEDTERKVCVGYKDVGPDEFWVRGHMPGMPLMPGVVMLEVRRSNVQLFHPAVQHARGGDGRIRRSRGCAIP